MSGPHDKVPDSSDCEIAPRAAVPSRQALPRITEQSGDPRVEGQFSFSCSLRDEDGNVAVDVDSQVIAWFANAE